MTLAALAVAIWILTGAAVLALVCLLIRGGQERAPRPPATPPYPDVPTALDDLCPTRSRALHRLPAPRDGRG